MTKAPVGQPGDPRAGRSGEALDPLNQKGLDFKSMATTAKPPKFFGCTTTTERDFVVFTSPEKVKEQSIKLAKNPVRHVEAPYQMRESASALATSAARKKTRSPNPM